ncbi:MAG TPA: cupin domain-containing protein [Opitutus sp.]|nr:cupin domain-containing protein [Opitutus sp.]
MNVVHLPSLPWQEMKSPTGKFQSFVCNVSLALGGIANTGPWGGGHPFDVQLRRVPPGAKVCPFHGHLAQWELFVVRRGTATVRTDEGLFTLRAGEVFYHPPGVSHQLMNNGSEELEVLIVADNPPLDSCVYPDSNKRSLRPPGKFFRIEEVHYFDGEDELPADVPPFKASPSPAALDVAPFARRRLHPDDLPWAAWASPRGKFRGESKELSIALGAKRNAPTGLGGHPFDLELSKLRPNESGCPFHSHAAEWEMFMILRGSATVRAKAETRTLHAGDVVLHPPGEAHQITIASDSEDLVFHLIASNAPVEYWHYPDSNKWGLRSPRGYFRATAVDYWDGEE